jgi:S1-C subfamily serine protease
VRTLDGQVYPVQEVLAASRSTDIAIVRIPAKGLAAAALSAGEPPGTPVTVIAHPAGRFYFLTQGHISRYSAWINYGRAMVGMSITAEFCPGSSGAPVFAETGAVAGIVASVHDLGGGMVDKQCMPAQAIQALLKTEP